MTQYLMRAMAAGEVVASRHADFKPGEALLAARARAPDEGLMASNMRSWREGLPSGMGGPIAVLDEIKRAKAVGPGAVCVANGSHHQWGNLGHYLSAFNRFWNLIGVTKLVHNPDSWEGWYWGAMHHWGNSLRLGAPEFYGTVEDCLKEAEMMVFWSSDPDATYGFDGPERREWAKQLGIKMIHIDPYLNHTAAHLGEIGVRDERLAWLARRAAAGEAVDRGARGGLGRCGPAWIFIVARSISPASISSSADIACAIDLSISSRCSSVPWISSSANA